MEVNRLLPWTEGQKRKYRIQEVSFVPVTWLVLVVHSTYYSLYKEKTQKKRYSIHTQETDDRERRGRLELV
jgi:hypothetical protein